jgi:hypothetical protein
VSSEAKCNTRPTCYWLLIKTLASADHAWRFSARCPAGALFLEDQRLLERWPVVAKARLGGKLSEELVTLAVAGRMK